MGPYVPTMVAGNTTTEKPRENWSKEERRRVQYNLKFIHGRIYSCFI